jgi:Domain of unknown function (DUF4082)/Bacterial Ig-like domain
MSAQTAGGARIPRLGRRRSTTLVLAVLTALVMSLVPLAAGVPTASAATCPCTIWPSSATPAVAADPDTDAVELGVKFRADEDGFISGIRFYKGAGNTGTHLGRLWSSTGTQLASATFTGETASGWQQVSFASPVPITAGTTYVASYYAPVGRYSVNTGYFASNGVDNAPLHALANGVDGANGVYRYGVGGGFPTNTWQSANYWVDVVFDTSATDTTPPTVTTTSPAANATDIPTTTAVTATYSEPVQQASIAGTLTGPGGTVTTTLGYDAGTRTATWTPQAALAAGSHTMTISAATDTAGNTLAAPVSWSFSVASGACPCTIWPSTATPAVANVPDASSVELGVKFRSSVNGFVSAIRFYKGSGNTGTHTGSLWTSSGTQLATVTFSGESASGWQQATFGSPVAVTAGTTYVASYHTFTGFYSANNNYFTTSTTRGPLTALATGIDGGNGVYRYGAPGFPDNTYQASNYWVDVVLATSGADTVAPTVATKAPTDGATGVAVSVAPAATFSEDVVPSSIEMSMTGPGGANVPGDVSYNAGGFQATFTPDSSLAYSTQYTVRVTAATDAAGNQLAGAPVTWSFTTAAEPPPPPTQGAGGPVLVIGNTAAATSQFSLYTAEILRAEGITSFATTNLSQVTASTLADYDAVILGATPLTTSQVTMFTTWVQGGGRLITFRPDKQLAGLVGITDVGTTLARGYLKVDGTAAPGAGITTETIQFQSPADRYTLNGATEVAKLYSNATNATTNPAVVRRTVGSGQVAAFTFDLPRSIVYTRQGNPAWAGQERDGFSPIRSDDLYFGGNATDWVNLNKVAIPQADEQQRLLVNLLTMMMAEQKPLPRFWYFPRDAKAVVVATGDDHGNGGTSGRFDQYDANSPAGCSVDDWQCLRFSSYVFPGTPISDAAVTNYQNKGFRVGLHPQNGCTNFTPSSLASTYTTQLAQFAQNWPSGITPKTSRYHCIVYSDWASQPKTEFPNGIRLDTNYYYWPGSWINNRPGFMTGSGMPMRFADTNGTMIDVYQAATQMTDESNQSYPFTPNTLFDNAMGSLGYYGAFTANLHTDNATTFEDDQVIASATARGVPVVSAEQMLTWLDGRNGSTFGSMTWSGNTLSFTMGVGAGANGLRAMIPTTAPGGTTLSGVTRDGAALTVTTQIIKGVSYGFVDAAPGSYVASYSAQAAPSGGTLASASTLTADLSVTARTTATVAEAEEVDDAESPAINGVDVLPLPDGTASVTWSTDEAASSGVMFGLAADLLDGNAVDGTLAVSHDTMLTQLEPGQTYYYRIVSTDAAGNVSTEPAKDAPPARFVSAAKGVADHTLAALRMGQRSAGAYLRQDSFGELSLTPETGEEFATPELPTSWMEEGEQAAGARLVTGGQLVLDGKRAGLRKLFATGRSVEAQVTFHAEATQYVGWASGRITDPYAMFLARNGSLVAAVFNGSRTTTTAVPGGAELLGEPHRYRIARSGTSVAFFVDGTQVASGKLPSVDMRPLARDLVADNHPLVIDWVRLSGHAASGTFTSRILDARELVTWDRAQWRADLPTGSTITVRVRTGSTPKPDSSWSSWTTLSGNGARVPGTSRYLQYQVDFGRGTNDTTPVLRAIGFTNNALPGEDDPGEGLTAEDQ